MKKEDVTRVLGRRGAVPHRIRDHPRVHLDTLPMRRVDERLQGIESRSDRLVDREARSKAEAVAAAHDLSHDRVRVRRLRRGQQRVDLRLVVEALAEGIRPEGAELARSCASPSRRAVRWECREQAGQVPENSRKRG